MFVARAPSIFGHLKLTVPPLWLVVVLPLAYFTAAYISLSLFGANSPLWMSNAFVVDSAAAQQAFDLARFALPRCSCRLCGAFEP